MISIPTKYINTQELTNQIQSKKKKKGYEGEDSPSPQVIIVSVFPRSSLNYGSTLNFSL